MYTHTQIPAEIIPYLWNIYSNKFKKTENVFTNVSFASPLFYSDIDELLLKSKKIMEIYGYKFKSTDSDIFEKIHDTDEIDWLFELHNYKIDGYYEPVIGTHCDDRAALNADVNTVIFYLNKDETIQGGNLIVFNSYTDKIKLEIKSGDMIIMKGDVVHEIEPMDGFGNRISIVVQIQRD